MCGFVLGLQGGLPVQVADHWFERQRIHHRITVALRIVGKGWQLGPVRARSFLPVGLWFGGRLRHFLVHGCTNFFVCRLPRSRLILRDLFRRLAPCRHSIGIIHRRFDRAQLAGLGMRVLEFRNRRRLEFVLVNRFYASFDDHRRRGIFRQRFSFRHLYRILGFRSIQPSRNFTILRFGTARSSGRRETRHPMRLAGFAARLGWFIRRWRHHVHPSPDPRNETRTARFVGIACFRLGRTLWRGGNLLGLLH